VESEQAGRNVESGAGVGKEPHAPAEPEAASAGNPAPSPGGTDKPSAQSSFKKHPALKLWLLLALVVCAAVVALLYYDRQRRALLGSLKTGAEQVKEILTGAAPRDPYAEAVSKIEEDRGEPAGRKAAVEIPAELKQYRDARRFLAIQGAAATEAGLTPPHDFAALAGMIAGGRELVEAPRLGRGFALYGVGLTATGALTHYDAKARKVVPLFANVEELEASEREVAAERERLTGELKEFDDRLKGLGRREREERARLLAEVAARKKDLTSVAEREKLLAAYYGKPGGKDRAQAGEKLFAEYATLQNLARDFGGRGYDLRDATAAKEFQARMLSYVRPAALAVLEELGTAYESKYGRRLPVTSLVRTEEYQRLLRESGNPNAADAAQPPHTTGLAFDIYYRYLTAAEQEFVMSEIARLEREGRVEALRELRDHYHVFVFAAGHPPSEESVDKVLGKRAQPEKAEKAEKQDKRSGQAQAAKKERPGTRPARRRK
jgi:hypothetical protein